MDDLFLLTKSWEKRALIRSPAHPATETSIARDLRHKDKLPKGAYSDINIGDEAVWTDVNGTLTVRKDRISIQIELPEGKMEQVKVAGALVEKM